MLPWTDALLPNCAQYSWAKLWVSLKDVKGPDLMRTEFSSPEVTRGPQALRASKTPANAGMPTFANFDPEL